MVKNHLRTFLAILIILILLLTGCFFPNNEDENEITLLHYDIEININNVTNFTIHVPILIGWDDFVDNIQILEGNVTYEIILTEFGEALKIRGNGNISLNSDKKINGGKHFDISLLDQKTWTVKIYCDKTPTQSSLSIMNHLSYHVKNSKNGDFDTTYYIKSELESGWQDINVLADSGGG